MTKARKSLKKIAKNEKHLTRMIKRDAVQDNLDMSARNGREAAVAVLDPITAVNRGFIPGRPDGEVNATVKFFTTSKHTMTSQSWDNDSADVLQLRIAPFPDTQVTQVATWGPVLPATYTNYSDDNYADMVSEFQGVRCVSQVVTIRCLDNPLDLNGDRTGCLGGKELIYQSPGQIQTRKDVYTTGNNKPGEVSVFVNPDPGDGEFHAADWAWSVGDNYDGNCIYVACFTEAEPTQKAAWLVTVLSIWEGIPTSNSLLTPTEFVADPSVYAAAIKAALEECPLNSHERVTYEDDGAITSVISDVQTILGTGKKLLGAAANVKKTASNALDFFDSFGAGIGSVVSGAFGGLGAKRHGLTPPEVKEDPTPLMCAARLYVAINRDNPLGLLAGIREIFNGRTDMEVWEYLCELMQIRREMPDKRIRPKRKRDDWQTLAPPQLTRGLRRP